MRMIVVLIVCGMLAGCGGSDHQEQVKELRYCQRIHLLLDSTRKALDPSHTKEEEDLIEAHEVLMQLCYASMLLDSARKDELDTTTLPTALPGKKVINTSVASSLMSASMASSIAILASNGQLFTSLKLNSSLTGSGLKMNPLIVSAALGSSAISSLLPGSNNKMADSIESCWSRTKASCESLVGNYASSSSKKFTGILLLNSSNESQLYNGIKESLSSNKSDTNYQSDPLYIVKLAQKKKIISDREYNVFVDLHGRISRNMEKGESGTTVAQRIDQTHQQVCRAYAAIVTAAGKQPDSLLNDKLVNLNHNMNKYFIVHPGARISLKIYFKKQVSRHKID